MTRKWERKQWKLYAKPLKHNSFLSLSLSGLISADRVAQRLGHLVPSRDVSGSNPALGTIFLLDQNKEKNDATSRSRTGDLSVTEAVPYH